MAFLLPPEGLLATSFSKGVCSLYLQVVEQKIQPAFLDCTFLRRKPYPGRKLVYFIPLTCAALAPGPFCKLFGGGRGRNTQPVLSESLKLPKGIAWQRIVNRWQLGRRTIRADQGQSGIRSIKVKCNSKTWPLIWFSRVLAYHLPWQWRVLFNQRKICLCKTCSLGARLELGLSADSYWMIIAIESPSALWCTRLIDLFHLPEHSKPILRCLLSQEVLIQSCVSFIARNSKQEVHFEIEFSSHNIEKCSLISPSGPLEGSANSSWTCFNDQWTWGV